LRDPTGDIAIIGNEPALHLPEFYPLVGCLFLSALYFHVVKYVVDGWDTITARERIIRIVKTACVPIALWGTPRLAQMAIFRFGGEQFSQPTRETASVVYPSEIVIVAVILLSLAAILLSRLWPLLGYRGKLVVVLSTPVVFGLCYLASRYEI
jgi:hypothetical protein